MGPRGLALLLPLAALLDAPRAAAQEPDRGQDTSLPDTLLRFNAASILFDRNANTYNWTGAVRLDTVVAATEVSLRGALNSNAVAVEDPGGTRKLRSDQTTLSLSLGQPVAPDLRARLLWSSLVNADNRSAGLSDVSNHGLLAGAAWSPLPELTLTPLVGYRWENQSEANDRGPGYALLATTGAIMTEGYRLLAAGQVLHYDLAPRAFDRDFLRASLDAQFSPGSRDSLEVGFSRLRRDFYVGGGTTVESRVEQVFDGANLLSFDAGGGVHTQLFVRLTARQLDKNLLYEPSVPETLRTFDTVIDELRLAAHLQGDYRTAGFDVSLRLSHLERTESHAARLADAASAAVEALWRLQNIREQAKDNASRWTSLAGSLTGRPGGRHRITLTGSASILRYDTPSGLNVEDRDESLFILALGTFHPLSRFLDLALTLEGTQSHVVYLLGDRSANNAVNRVLRLAPRTWFRPAPWLTSMNEFEVLANYTVYDFEDVLAQARSFSYRQFAWADSTVLDLDGRLGLDFLAYLRFYDRGQLDWGDFTERLENSFAERTFAGQVRYVPSHGFSVAVGLRSFSQDRYRYEGTAKVLESTLRSFGPTCVVLWQAAARGSIALRGWLEQRTQQDGVQRTYPNMTMQLQIAL
jgi:hypothetical protein